MLSNTLVTNEVKNAAAVKRDFTRLSIADRSTEFALIGEVPSAPHRLSIKHQETGTGLKQRRRSVIRFDKTSVSDVDSVTPVTTSAYIVLDAPIGATTTAAQSSEVLANLMSFLATTGAATTVLFDCTGNGAASLVNGSL